MNKFKMMRRLIQIAITILLLYLIYTLFWSDATIETFQQINYLYLALAVFFYLVALAVVGYRFKMVVETQTKTTFKDTFWCNLYGMLMGEVTPGKVGYILCIFPLEKRGVSKTISLSCITITQIMDFILRGIIGICAILYLAIYLDIIPKSESMYYLLISVFLIVGLGAMFYVLVYTTLPQKLIKRFGGKHNEKLLNGLMVLQDMKTKTKSIIGRVILLTVLAWVLTGLRWVFVSYALGLNIPILVLLLLQPLITLLSFIPITIGGLGLLEGGVIKALSFLKVQEAKALAFVIVDRIVMIAVELPAIVLRKKGL